MKFPRHGSMSEIGLPWRWVVLAAATAALLAAVLVSSQIQLSMIDHGHDWWRIFAWQLVGWGFWVPMTPWLISVGARLSRSRLSPALWLRELAIALGVALIHIPLAALAFTVLQPYLPVDRYSFLASLVRSLASWFHVDLLLYGSGLALGYGLSGYRSARASELRESQLETELARAQLETLRLQIQPHFLFNTLNSVASLVRRKRNDRALEMLLGLSELLRSTLDRSQQLRIPLAEELDFISRYVELQRARFADRLTVHYDVAEECLEQPVPNFLLQPLVENAIRHGISQRAAPGSLQIHARLEGGRLYIEVADDGIGLPAGFDAAEQQGVGLSNTRSRLQQLYGERASLTVDKRTNGGTQAVVVLPAELAPALQRIATG
ncbi:MAG: histidine kinase [Acidobacteriota bacterium]